MKEYIKIAIEFFKENGCTVLNPKHINANGPDLNIIKNDEAFRVEIKQINLKKCGSYQVPGLSLSRLNDDYILIMYKNKIIQFISLKDHLKLCSESGVRIMTQEMNILK